MLFSVMLTLGQALGDKNSCLGESRRRKSHFRTSKGAYVLKRGRKYSLFASSHLRIFPSSVFILILCLLLIATGCAPAKRVSTGPSLPPPPDIIEKISRANLRDKILTGTARMTVESPEGFYSANCVIAVQYPSSLRLETLPPLGPPDLYLTIRGNSMKVYLPRKEKFYVSRDAKRSILHFIPLRLDLQDVIPLLTGMLPPGTLENRNARSGEKEDLLYRIDTFSDKKRRRHSIWLEPEKTEIARFETYAPDGNVLYAVTFKEYKIIREISIPDKIEIRLEGEEGKDASIFRIRYSDIQLSSEEENKDLFDLEIPSGIKPQFLD